MRGFIGNNKLALIALLILVVAFFTITYLRQNPASTTAPARDAGTNNEKMVHFYCSDGKSITATFYPGNDTHVNLSLSDGRSLAVPHAISASGARYANEDESFVFWNKGDTAFITEDSTTTYDSCALPGTAGQLSGWVASQNATSGAAFSYPEILPTTYIHTVDWPPKVTLEDKPYSCSPAGTETARAGETKEETIHGNNYCVTVETGGAAGSIYRQYAYAFSKDGRTAILTFSLRFVQCENYEEPKRSECTAERNVFDIKYIVDQMADTLNFGS